MDRPIDEMLIDGVAEALSSVNDALTDQDTRQARDKIEGYTLQIDTEVADAEELAQAIDKAQETLDRKMARIKGLKAKREIEFDRLAALERLERTGGL